MPLCRRETVRAEGRLRPWGGEREIQRWDLTWKIRQAGHRIGDDTGLWLWVASAIYQEEGSTGEQNSISSTGALREPASKAVRSVVREASQRISSERP